MANQALSLAGRGYEVPLDLARTGGDALEQRRFRS